MKDHCVACKVFIINQGEEYYELNGNFCRRCCFKANAKANKRLHEARMFTGVWNKQNDEEDLVLSFE